MNDFIEGFLNMTGYKFESHDWPDMVKDEESAQKIARAINKGDIAIMLNVYQNGSTHAVVPTKVTFYSNKEIQMTVADPLYGLKITQPSNYISGQHHAYFIIKKPSND